MILKPLVNLCIEWIIVQQICAVEYLAVGLVKCDHIFFSFEYLDLILIIQLNLHYMLRFLPRRRPPAHS